jgi:hypothetical protein
VRSRKLVFDLVVATVPLTDTSSGHPVSAASRARSRACPACSVCCSITGRSGCRRARSSHSSAASPEAFPVLLGLKIRTTRSKGCIRSPCGHPGHHLLTFRQAQLPESWAAPPARCAAPSAHIRFGRWTPERPTLKDRFQQTAAPLWRERGVWDSSRSGGSSPTPSRRILPRAPLWFAA